MIYQNNSFLINLLISQNNKIMDYLCPEVIPTRKDSNCSQSVEYEEFVRENYDVLQYGPSQTSIKMIDALINSNTVPVELVKHQLRQLILLTLQDIALNEFQVAF